MKIRKRLLGLALCLCAAACVLCVGASAEDHTDHPICGKTHKDIGDHTGTCKDVTWTELTRTSVTGGDLRLDGGNSYYLGEDIEVNFWIEINGEVNLCLNGHSIKKTSDSEDAEDVFTVIAGSSFTLCDCNGSGESNGKITHAPGKIGRGVLVGSDGPNPRTTFIMYGGEISGNRVGTKDAGMDGAGVLVQCGKFIMYGGKISKNRVEVVQNHGGGGVCVYRGGKFIMRGGEISGNTSVKGGGVSILNGSFEIYGDSKISGNTAGQNGGGVTLWNAPYTLSGGEISGNTATGNGGGVFYCGVSDSHILTVSDSVIIKENTAVNGGGIYVDAFEDPSALTLNGGSISNNNVTGNGGGVYFGGDTFNLSGDVSITGNKKGTAANNVYLPSGKAITIAGELKNTTPIGVTTEKTPDSSSYVQIATATGANRSYAVPGKFQYENDDNISISAVTSGITNVNLVVCEHNWRGTWSTDDSSHWHECNICKGKGDEAAHTYSKEAVSGNYLDSAANCTSPAIYFKSCECGAKGTDTFEHGDKDPSKHTGELGTSAWKYDENTHWREYPCCNAKVSVANHSDGKATCTGKAMCHVCGAEYGSLDPDNHAGTGTTWTKTTTTHKETYDCCGAVKTTEAAHTFGEWRDGKRSCDECGYEETCAHTGGTATCTAKAVCGVCGTAYGELDASNHDWGEWAVTTPATTSATGVETRTCTRDASHTETRDIPKLTPAPSGGSGTPTITVPVTGSRDTVQVSASVSGSTAEVKEVKKTELDKIGTDSDVVIDLSGLNKSVTGVTLPIDTIRGISESEADGVTIKLPQAELRVDQKTLAAVSEQAKGSKVQLVVETDSKAKSTMTAAQKSALDGMKNAAALEAYFVSNGTRIRDFNGGEVELSVPYQASGAIRAWYLKEDGTREPVSARYDKENARLILRHFSHYVIEELDSSTAYTVCAKDSTCPLAAFGDLTATAWYHDGVHYCLENGLMQGVSTAEFLPDGSTTRAQLVTILWRLEGSPETTGAVSFGDVADGAWYAKAVRWAAGSGVVKGYNSEHFGPDDAVTREQMVTILYRYAQYKGYDVSVGEDTNILSFADALTVSEYAIPAMQWACGSGLVTGIAREGGTFLAPADTTVRVQTATLMMRFPGALVKTA